MKPDPPVRRDRKCAQCGGPRLTRLPKVATKRSLAELVANLELDAFCSATCARAFFGTTLDGQPEKSPGGDDAWVTP